MLLVILPAQTLCLPQLSLAALRKRQSDEPPRRNVAGKKADSVCLWSEAGILHQLESTNPGIPVPVTRL